WADSLHLLEAGRILGRDPREVLTGPPEPVVPGRHLGCQPARELDRRGPADLRNPQCREDPLERSSSGTLYRAVEVLCALAGEPIQGFEILDREPVEVAPPADDPPLEELAEYSPPGSLDVHAAAPREVAELLPDAGRALEIRAVVADGSLVADDRRVAHRAAGRHFVLALGTRPPLGDGSDDFGDDVAGLLEHGRGAPPATVR